jgi:Peroxisomal membrane protein (Pex16)
MKLVKIFEIFIEKLVHLVLGESIRHDAVVVIELIKVIHRLSTLWRHRRSMFISWDMHVLLKHYAILVVILILVPYLNVDRAEPGAL